MVSIDDLKDLILYKKPFYLPIDTKNKKYGSAIMLMTPNYKSSMLAMTAPYTVNKRYFESYYIEKNITRYIQNESVIENIDDEYIFEETLSSDDRKNLKNSDFGLPSQRRYPMPDEDHVLAAIRLFNHVEKEYEEELASNIIKKIKYFDMVDKIRVGDKNRFKPYWIKSGLTSVNESKSVSREDVINIINSALEKENIKTHISKNGEWGSKNFIEGKSSTVCLGSFNSETYTKVFNIVKGSLPEGYKVKKDNYFTIFIKAKDNINESYEYNEFDSIYLSEFVNKNALKVSEKISANKFITFNGYKKDIDEVKKYINIKLIEKSFDKLNMKLPEKITIYCVSDSNIDSEFTSDSYVVFTKSALKRKAINFDYSEYIKYVTQLYVIYSLKARTNNGKVLDSIAEPTAILLSGIADEIIARDNHYGDGFTLERVFKYTIETYGVDYFREKILKNNDVKLILKLTKEYNKDIQYNIFNEVSYSLLMEESEGDEPESSATTISTPSISIGEIPESIKKIQNMATNLKRKIRKNSVYKLNKIVRDIRRGNNGTENRVTTGIEKIQNGDINQESVSIKDLQKYSGGDYITEGNYVYLFEDSKSYDAQLRKALYKERFKTNKQVLAVYNKVKSDLPFIKYTYVDFNRYNRRNIFIDLSYYNESFFKNITNLNDEDKKNTTKLYNIYLELMGRLLRSDKLGTYTKQSIFIPVLDWQHNNSMKMWIYKEDLNPISIIYNLMRTNPSKIKTLFGNNDVIFLGGKNYFKINFSKFDFSNKGNIDKFVNLIRRIVKLGYNSPADPDPEGDFDSSPKGIAMDLVDKVERSQNVSINDVSKISTLSKSADLFIATNTAVDSSFIEKPNIAIKKDAINVPSSNLSGKVTTVPAGNMSTGNYIRGKAQTAQVVVDKKVVTTASNKADTGVPNNNSSVNKTSEEAKKNSIMNSIAKASANALNTDNALDNLDKDDEFKQLLLDLQNDSSDNVRVDRTRASKVVATEEEFHKKEVAGKSVRDLLNTDVSKNELPKIDLKIASINDGWSNMTFMNFDKNYDPDSDIVKMLDSMQHWTFPIAIKNIDVKDNSTSEDIVDLWTIDCVDYKNTKFTLKIDIPRFINGSNFLKLRGNEKTLMIQSALLPIIKTNLEECQIIGSGGYNKIFVRKFGSRTGQSMPSSSKLIRALNKYTQGNKDIKVTPGNNIKICSKYELPIDYIDISGVINIIETANHKVYFNQDELRLHYEVDDTKGIPIGIEKVYDANLKKGIETILYYGDKEKSIAPTISQFIARVLSSDSAKFNDIYYGIITTNARCSYSEASILNVRMPVVIACGYLEGLISTMKKAGIEYSFVQNINSKLRHNDDWDYIKFKDGYLIYKVTYSSSLLLNGLKKHDTEEYSLKDVNSRKMYLDFLELYGGMIKADGLENSYDCMIDPITKEILEKFKLPTDYIGVLLHANTLLADNKYVRHTDQAGRRWRRKELIAGYFYKALTTSYQEYANSNRHSRKNSKMTIKQSAVIDLIVSKDPSTSDLSINNVINDVECANTVTNKGLAGMNAARAYTVNTRGYDESMLNLLGMDTGFSGNVGINRQATIDANIEGGRGFVKSIEGDTDKISTVKALTITEALTPLGCTHDDPSRTLMTYVQTSKHMIRCDNNDPTLITTGADEAMPYLVSDMFAYKAKKDGTVVELVQEGFGKQNYIVIEYKDGTHDFINLSEEVKKNSDGGYYVPLKLDTDLKLGSKVKEGSVVAYDKLSFSKSLGESGNLAANIGTLAKVAIINTDEGFEDSAAITESFARKLGSDVIMNIDSKIDKGSNIFIYKEIGDPVMEGDTLFATQSDFNDDVVNTLLKNLTADEDQISELGRKPVKSKYTGTVANIEIYRTCELDEMSESLRKFVTKHENKTRRLKSIYNKYGIDTATLPPTEKVPEVGKTKNLDKGVMINYYIKYNDSMSVGDKIVFYSANKGIIKYLIPEDVEPYTEFRPDEHVDSFMSLSSISGRMTASIALYAATSKLMIELDRSVKDIAGIPYDVTKI